MTDASIATRSTERIARRRIGADQLLSFIPDVPIPAKYIGGESSPAMS
jgi:hypothetical protein